MPITHAAIPIGRGDDADNPGHAEHDAENAEHQHSVPRCGSVSRRTWERKAGPRSMVIVRIAIDRLAAVAARVA